MQQQPTPLPESIRQIAARHTQVTGPIRPIRLTNTGPLPAIQPPASVVIHIGSVQPSLVNLTPVSLSILVTGFEMAYKYRHVYLQDAQYVITKIFPDEERPSRIMARLEREDA